jgi:glycosyltransferase involved in cell wall biosynthesis
MKLTIIVPVYNQEVLVTRALDSIPRRNDIEVLIVNDGSTDNTKEVITNYQQEHQELNIRIINLPENKGLGNAKNVGYDNAVGEYVNQLDSDDFLYTSEYNRVVDMLDGTDMVYMSLRANDGGIFNITKANQRGLCSGCARFIKKSFLGDTRCPIVDAGEDWALNEELQAKPHTDKFTEIIGYHYNFPREGSLYDMMIKGQLKPRE